MTPNITIHYDASHPDLQDCPAGCNIQNGEIVINPKLFYKLSPFEQKFVLLHEEGHIVKQTHIEEEADAYAFDYLAGSEFRSLKQMVEFLEELLILKVPRNEARKQALFERAYAWDNDHPITDKATSLKLFGVELWKIGDAEADARKNEAAAQANRNDEAINAGVLAAAKDDASKNTPMIVMILAGLVVAYLLISD